MIEAAADLPEHGLNLKPIQFRSLGRRGGIMADLSQFQHPRSAWMYERISAESEQRGTAEQRGRLLAGLSGRVIDVVAQQLLGCTVGHRAHSHVRLRKPTDIVDVPGDSEVAQKDSSFTILRIGEQDICGLDVAVQKTVLMRVVERTGNSRDDPVVSQLRCKRSRT